MNYEEVFRDAIRSEVKRREGTVTRFAEVDALYFCGYRDSVQESELDKYDEEMRLFTKSKNARENTHILVAADARCIGQYHVHWKGLLESVYAPSGAGWMMFYEFDWNAAEESKLINATIRLLTGKLYWGYFFRDKEFQGEAKWNEFDLDEECDEETEKRLREAIREVFENATRYNGDVQACWNELNLFGNHIESASLSEIVEKLKEILAFCQEYKVEIKATIVGERFVRRRVGELNPPNVKVDKKTLILDRNTSSRELNNVFVKGEWFVLTTEEFDFEREKRIEWLADVMKESPSGELELTVKGRETLRAPKKSRKRKKTDKKRSLNKLKKHDLPFYGKLTSRRRKYFESLDNRLEDVPIHKRANIECRRLVRLFVKRENATIYVRRTPFAKGGCFMEYEFFEKFPKSDYDNELEHFALTLYSEDAWDALFHGLVKATSRRIKPPPIVEKIPERVLRKLDETTPRKGKLRRIIRIVRLKGERCRRALRRVLGTSSERRSQ